MVVLRVFPRKTRATPCDDWTRYGPPGPMDEPPDAVHVSVTFTWDIPHAEWLARQWDRIAPVFIGGPAMGTRGDDFTPGQYIKPGYVITSRGCPNKCWFCDVWKRDGTTRELPIMDGWNVLDDNLLACSDDHIRAVFAMLKRQPHRAEFTGGLEAKRLKWWHMELLADLKPKQVFFAYDTPDDWEHLTNAMAHMEAYGFNRNVARCYVLIGYPGDTLEDATGRLLNVKGIGMCPMAMLYRDKNNTEQSPCWRRLQRLWARPALIYREGMA